MTLPPMAIAAVVAAALPLVVEPQRAAVRRHERVARRVHHHAVPRRRAAREQLRPHAGVRGRVGPPPAVAVPRADQLGLHRAVLKAAVHSTEAKLKAMGGTQGPQEKAVKIQAGKAVKNNAGQALLLARSGC